VDRPRRAHAERFTKRFLCGIGAHGHDDDFAGQLERRLHGIAVEVAHVPLEPGLVDARATGRDLEAHVHLGNALDADGDLHRRTSLVKDFTRKGRRP
jgi:hypothetical protein